MHILEAYYMIFDRFHCFRSINWEQINIYKKMKKKKLFYFF